MKGSWV